MRAAGRGGSRSRGRRKVGGPWWSKKAEELFFKVLAEKRNVRVAAEATGFSTATVYALRRKRADFRERWTEALARAPLDYAPFDCAQDRRDERGGGSIVRYARASTGSDSRAKRVRCHVQWSEEVEEAFLDVLAATCNVSLACDEVGVGHTTVYRHRRQRADFAAKWQTALEQGYARLEIGLVRAANDSLDKVEFDAERPIPSMSAETALKVLQAHRAAVMGVGRRTGWKAPPKPVEFYRESILKKIAAIKTARPFDGAQDRKDGDARRGDGSAGAGG